jgi:hypothetical protein
MKFEIIQKFVDLGAATGFFFIVMILVFIIAKSSRINWEYDGTKKKQKDSKDEFKVEDD